MESAEGAGQVIAARTQNDDRDARPPACGTGDQEEVAAQMQRRGLTAATAAPDVTLTYYLIMTAGTSAQTAGQFLPSVTEWGLPPFSPVDHRARGDRARHAGARPERRRNAWSGGALGEAGFSMDTDLKKRGALLREAIKKVLEKYPPKEK